MDELLMGIPSIRLEQIHSHRVNFELWSPKLTSTLVIASTHPIYPSSDFDGELISPTIGTGDLTLSKVVLSVVTPYYDLMTNAGWHSQG